MRIAVRDGLDTPLADLRRPGTAVEREGPDSVIATVLPIPAASVAIREALGEAPSAPG